MGPGPFMQIWTSQEQRCKGHERDMEAQRTRDQVRQATQLGADQFDLALPCTSRNAAAGSGRLEEDALQEPVGLDTVR